MSVQSIYMDDGVTETDDFKTLWQCLESEIEHYEDILKAKLVSLLCICLTIHFATVVSLLAIGQLFTCNCYQLTLQLVNYFSHSHQPPTFASDL